jgi:hypothetical protein
MTIHFFSAKKLRARLALGAVGAREQAFYLAGSFIVWIVPGYLFLIPAPSGINQTWFYGMWFYEFALSVLIYAVGIYFCLAKCHVHPKRNFMIDFGCLYFPVSVTTLLVTWLLFHVIATLLPWSLTQLSFDVEPTQWFLLLTSARFFDLMRFLAVVGAAFAVFYRIGRHMEHVARARASANPALNTDAGQAGSARSPSAG